MTNSSQLLVKLTDAYAAQGYQGKQLTEKVLSTAYIYALALGASEAATHFKSRLTELDIANLNTTTEI